MRHLAASPRRRGLRSPSNPTPTLGAPQWGWRPQRRMDPQCKRQDAASTKRPGPETLRGRVVRLSDFGTKPLLLRQLGFDRLDDFFGVGFDLGLKSGDDFAVAADQELLEVPGDVAGKLRLGLF